MSVAREYCNGCSSQKSVGGAGQTVPWVSTQKLEKDEEGEEVYVTVDDEDEFDKVANFFDDLFDEDYDA